MAVMTEHVQTTIRYDGPALSAHEMDVQDLAPALIALAEIVQIANRRFNGDRATMRVLVNADTEQKCFQLDLSLVQSWIDQAQHFFGKDNVATAKTIAGLIGLTGSTTGTLFGLYKWLFAKKENATAPISFTQNDVTGLTIVNVFGDGNSIEVQNEVALLASDPDVLKRVKQVLRPLQKKGYKDFTVLNKDKPVIKIDSDEAEGIFQANPPSLVPAEEEPKEAEPTYATGPAWVDTSHFRGAAKWTLLWGGQRVDARMPEAFLQAFQDNETIVVPNTKLTVRMKVTTKVDDNGMPTGATEFEVEEVVKVDLPPKAAKQLDWLDGAEPAKDA